MRRDVRSKKVLRAISFAVAVMIAVAVTPISAQASAASPAETAEGQAGGEEGGEEGGDEKGDEKGGGEQGGLRASTQPASTQPASSQPASEANEGENDQGNTGVVNTEEDKTPLVEIEATVENVEKLLNDINQEETGADASTLTVYYNTPESSPLKAKAQDAHDNVMITKTCLDDLKTGLEKNSDAVEAAEKISNDLEVTELVKEKPDVVDQNDPKLFEFVNEDGSKTQVECVNNFGDCASTFDAQMKLAEQELQNAKNAQNAASDKEAKDYAVESRNYLSNANSAITTANGLIIAAEAAITTAKEDLNTANNAFAKGKSKAELTSMQNNLIGAKDRAGKAAESASTVYSEMKKLENESSNPVDPNTKTIAKEAEAKTKNLSIEINRLKVTDAPGEGALQAVNGQIAAAERRVSLAKKCLSAMQERYDQLQAELDSSNLLPKDLEPENRTPSGGSAGPHTDDIGAPSGDPAGLHTDDIGNAANISADVQKNDAADITAAASQESVAANVVTEDSAADTDEVADYTLDVADVTDTVEFAEYTMNAADAAEITADAAAEDEAEPAGLAQNIVNAVVNGVADEQKTPGVLGAKKPRNQEDYSKFGWARSGREKDAPSAVSGNLMQVLTPESFHMSSAINAMIAPLKAVSADPAGLAVMWGVCATGCGAAGVSMTAGIRAQGTKKTGAKK